MTAGRLLAPLRTKRAAVAGKVIFAVAVIVAVAYALITRWADFRTAAANAHPRWGYIILSAIVVLANYALLVEAWRTVVLGWEGGRAVGGAGRGTTSARLGFVDAARIWSVSNLGRYVPGKVWQMGSMAMMAQARGISGVAAAGSAVLVTLINTVAGFIVLAATGSTILRVPPVAIIVLALLGVGVLLAPHLLPWLAGVATRITRRPIAIPAVPHRAVWLASLISVASWVVYGCAFRLFAAGILPAPTGAVGFYVAVFTSSYLVGFLALIVPGGVGVREVIMVAALESAGFATGDAVLIALASRIWLTVLEIVPAVLFLAYRRVRPRRSDGSTAISPP